MHRFEEAVRYASRDVELRKQLFGPADVEVSSSILTLATVLCEAGDYMNACKQCKRALSIREKQMGATDQGVAPCCNLLALVLRHLGKYQEAKLAAERSLNIRRGRFGDRPRPETAASLNGLAEVERERNPSLPIFLFMTVVMMVRSAAEEHCREGLQMRRTVLPEGHLSIGLSLQTLASILVKEDIPIERLKEAETCIEESIIIREKHFGEQCFQSMAGYDVWTRILCKLHRLNEAEEKAHVAVDIKTKTLGHNHPEVGRSLLVLGGVLIERGSFSAAKQKLNRASSIFTLTFGDDHPLVHRAHQLMQSINEQLRQTSHQT